MDKKPAFSTNHDLFIIDTQTMIEKKITGNPAWDGRVCYSPDGNYIAYVAMSKPGYESDRTQLIIYNRKNNRVNPLSDKLDRSVEEVGLVTGQ